MAYIYIQCNINVVAVLSYNCDGATIEAIISSTISVIIKYYYMHKQVGVKEYLMYGIRYFIFSIPVEEIAFVVGHKQQSSPVVSLIQVLFGCAVYAIILLVSKDKNMKMILHKIGNLLQRKT